jgi:hypothetical protein
MPDDPLFLDEQVDNFTLLDVKVRRGLQDCAAYTYR